jgi:DNA adenine methylase
MNDIEGKELSPILKWPGGKEKELKYIIPCLPNSIKNYYEPFVGGGAVYTAINAKKYFINDKSTELMALYNSISNDNRNIFFDAIEEIIHTWNLLSDAVKTKDHFFIKTYKDFSTNKINDEQIKKKVFTFIFNHSEQFNGMFSGNFNFDTANFITELEINLFRKIKRMKEIESKKKKLPDGDILNNGLVQ